MPQGGIENQIGVDLIGTDNEIFLTGNSGKSLELVSSIYCAARILGIAEKQKSALRPAGITQIITRQEKPYGTLRGITALRYRPLGPSKHSRCQM
jgi:hypothetical protein